MSEPSNNFDRPNLNQITTPTIGGGTEQKEDTQATIPETQAKHSTLESIRNFVVETPAGKVTAGIAGLLLLAGIGAGVKTGFDASANRAPVTHSAPSKTGEAKPTTKPSTEPSASATPEAPSNNAPDRYDFGIAEADVANLQAMDPTAFNSLNIKERAPLALYYAQDLPKFAKDWQMVSENPLDVLPAKFDATNTPDQILATISMAHRQAMTLTKADGFHFDKVAADKLIDASLINGNLSQAYGSLTSFTTSLDTDHAAPDASTLAISHYLELPTINHASDKYANAAGYTCIDLNITEITNGTSVTGDMTACLVPVGDNFIWMEQ